MPRRANTRSARLPVPTYEEVEARMNSLYDDTTKPTYMRESVFVWSVEFGMPHYESMCSVLAAFRADDPELRTIAQNAGERIFALGGMQAMHANFNIFSNFMVDASERGLYYNKRLEMMWSGIGEWLD